MSPDIKSLDSTDIMSDSKEKTPDQGITGEPAVLKRKTETAEDRKNWFYSNVAPRVLVSIMDEFELIQVQMDYTGGLSAEIQCFKSLATHVDALHKTAYYGAATRRSNQQRNSIRETNNSKQN